jgi:CheY-like chemotaxis protein/HPt (histidine-containing phosphotransfer) domain-containing protein
LESAVPSARARSARLLLAEDIEANQEIARAILEAGGYMVDIATNGIEAVKAVRTKAYDLVLMDVQMPGMDGLTATKRIRALPGPERNIPIIAMTANVLPEQVAEFHRIGMNDHVGKPFDRHDLYSLVERWLPDVMIVDTSPEDTVAGNLEPVLDAQTHGDLASLLGAERLSHLLEKFEAQLAASFAEDSSGKLDRMGLAREAHALISQAGMLGFLELSAVCRDLESACLANASVTDVLGRARKAKDRTLEEVFRLKTPAPASVA